MSDNVTISDFHIHTFPHSRYLVYNHPCQKVVDVTYVLWLLYNEYSKRLFGRLIQSYKSILSLQNIKSIQ